MKAMPLRPSTRPFATPTQTTKLIAIQYIDALKAIANGTASKVFIPYEATAVLGALGGMKELFKDTAEPTTSTNGHQPPAPPPPRLA